MKRKFAWLKDKEDKNDFRLLRILSKLSLPVTWLTVDNPMIYDQGSYPACVAYGMAGVKSDEEHAQSGISLIFRALKLYYECKRFDGSPSEEGTYPRVALKIVKKYGINQDGRTSLTDRMRWRIRVYMRIDPDASIGWIKQAMYQYGTILIGSSWYESWCNPVKENNYILPAPDVVVGGHAWNMIGWNGPNMVGRNSWGWKWGDNGLFYVPASYVKKIFEEGDAWVVVDLT